MESVHDGRPDGVQPILHVKGGQPPTVRRSDLYVYALVGCSTELQPGLQQRIVNLRWYKH
jgi:hypothetical protein